ncbi:MAG: serine hydrolase, partial [Acetobacteraceae bacterium]
IHTHLPELPDFGAPITIDHLMHNTSGLRDFLELMRLGGMDLEQQCATADVLEVLGRQRGLNFPPGSRFLDCNTNFLLLGLIIQKLSGQTLAAFMERRNFGPLGMTRTRLVTSPKETVPGLASGYFPNPGGGFVRAGHGFPLGGEGALVSSVADLALWDRNFTTGQVGGKALIEALTTRVPLNDGEANGYARGLAVGHYRGLGTVSHGGLWPGYRTEFLRLPKHGLTVIVIANLGSIVPYAMARAVVDAALENEQRFKPLMPLPERVMPERLVGCYVDRHGPATLEITLGADGKPGITANGVPFTLIADGKDRLVADASSFALSIQVTTEGLAVERVPGRSTLFRRAPESASLPADLAGRYACDEVGAVWTISSDDQGGMRARAAGPFVSGPYWEISPIAEDIIRVWTPNPLYRSWFDVRLERDSDGACLGLRVNGGRALGHFFARRE